MMYALSVLPAGIGVVGLSTGYPAAASLVHPASRVKQRIAAVAGAENRDVLAQRSGTIAPRSRRVQCHPPLRGDFHY
jgi:hypothetical protein